MNTARSPQSLLRTGAVGVAVGLSVLLVAGPPALAAQPASSAAAPAAAGHVDLGAAASYSVLAGAGVSNTGSATVLALDLGLNPSGVIAGFPPGVVTGSVHDKDAAAESAQDDRQAAYDSAVAQTGGTPFAGDQAGVTFTPGLYTSAAAVTNTGTIVLDANGDPGALFVFQVGAAMSSAAASKVVLIDGALAHNVYWQVAGAVSFGAGVTWFGTILAAGAVALGEGATLKGRILTSGTVALANSPVTKPIDDLTPPIVSVDGGTARTTSDTTPMLTGSTDEPAGRTVQVAVAGQTLTALVGASGGWAVSAATLTSGPHDVLASSTDPSGNTGTASQLLTVDVEAPVVTIVGGPSHATKDTTPTISGTTDEPGAPTVTVTVAGQTLTTTAAAGAWSVDAAVLTEAAHLVVASVDDAAGSSGTASQVLDVDVTVPVVTIDGGATRSTVDTSPWTYGTTAEKAGTTVHLAIGGQDRTATVLPGGTWGVSASALPEGSYLVVASVTDAAHNTGTESQVLTIGPAVGPGPGGNEPRHRPDAEIRRGAGGYVGKGTYGVDDQRLVSILRGRVTRTSFDVRMTNRGDTAEKMKVLGTRRSADLAVTYLAGGRNVTRAVLDGRYRTAALEPGGSATLVVRVTRREGAVQGSRRTFTIRVVSSHDALKRDTVAAVVKAVRR